MEEYQNTLLNWWETPFTQRIIAILLGITIILILRFFAIKALNRTISNNDHLYWSRKALNLFGYLLIVVVILLTFNDKLGNVGVALGVAGAGIAFALQEVIVSLAGWINIILTGAVSVGQRVKIGDVKGDIIDIGVMNTTIMELGDWVNGDLYNGSIATLANSFIFKEKVHNFSAEYPFLWDELVVPIRTETDYEYARQVFTKVVEEVCGEYARQSEGHWQAMKRKFKIEDARVQPMISLSFNENWISFTLRYVVDFKQRRSTKDKIYTHLLEEIKKSDGRITIATSAMEVTNIVAEGEQ